MHSLDLTLPTPEENLACDEALLEMCENQQSDEVLRLWEPAEHFVVLGYSNKIRNEINQAACKRHHIPVLRRPSGGGTVLLGPGCLNYSLILKIDQHPELKNITTTNRFVMARNLQALEPLLGPDLSIQGDTDLALGNLKFSGNSQRRKRKAVLFHGSFLLSLNFEIMESVLRLPLRQPEYRGNRTHAEFLLNLNLPPALIRERLCAIWDVEHKIESPLPTHAIEELVNTRYSKKDWNLKF